MQSTFQTMEEKEVLQSAQNGNGEAASFLLEKYKGMVRVLSRPLFLVDGEQDDLIQEGMIGLFKAIQTYDQKKGASFETFAKLCVSRQLYTAIEKANRKKNSPLNSYISIYSSTSFYQQTGEQDDGWILDQLQASWEKNPERIMIQRENFHLMLRELFSELSGMERRVLKLFLEGLTYREIAQRLTCTPKRIDNALQRIKIKMQKMQKKDLHSFVF